MFAEEMSEEISSSALRSTPQVDPPRPYMLALMEASPWKEPPGTPRVLVESKSAMVVADSRAFARSRRIAPATKGRDERSDPVGRKIVPAPLFRAGEDGTWLEGDRDRAVYGRGEPIGEVRSACFAPSSVSHAGWKDGQHFPLERMEGRKGADQKLRRYLLSGFGTSSEWWISLKKNSEIASRLC